MQTKLKPFRHIPVMLNETINFLKIKPDGVYVDATVGGAGHSFKIANCLSTGHLVCFDKDPDAVKFAKCRLSNFECVNLVNTSFINMTTELKQLNIFFVDGILFDLGVSSFQIDEPSRGFSYKTNGPLDMRMKKTGVSAFEVVNQFDEQIIRSILTRFGEEQFAGLIAKKIVQFRQNQAISNTETLAEIVKSAVPAKYCRIKNPCKKTFQAFRIYVNNELTELEEGLKQAFSLLKPKGRLVVISFHSLEDRIIKHFFVNLSRSCICPPKCPVCICNNKPKAKIITKKPVSPTKQEQIINQRCKSAKLRVLEKI